MPRIHIVTDSGARFSNPRLISSLPVTILPNTIDIDGKRYQEGVDLESETAFSLMAQPKAPPTVIPPSEEDFVELFARLSHHYDAVLSIHPSRELSESWHNARLAAQRTGGNCEFAIVDSRSLCAGQGMLIRVAARAAQEEDSVEAVIQTVLDAVKRIYSIYCVHDTRCLRARGIMKPSHSILSERLGIKPLVSVEGGEIIIIEKVLSESDTIERFIEFLVEFDALADALILQMQAPISEQTRILQDRLALEFPGQHFPFTMYSATMASYLGTAATGIAVLEKVEAAPYADF